MDDTHLLYQDKGGKQRKLIAEAKRLVDCLEYLARITKGYSGFIINCIYSRALDRYQRRYNRYYKQEA